MNQTSRPEQIVVNSSYNQTSGQLLDGTNMQLSFAGNEGKNYALVRSSSLSPPNWIPQATNPAGSFGALVFTNPPVPAGNNFWRIRSVPQGFAVASSLWLEVPADGHHADTTSWRQRGSGSGGESPVTREKALCSSGGFALDSLRPKTYALLSRMVKSAGSASARKSEMNIFRLFYSPEAAADAVFSI